MNALIDPIEEIKNRLDIVDVVGQKVALKKTGRTFKGLCPFHSEKTPSFIVFPEKGNYHCFGCSASGDVFTFVMKTENLEFAEALRHLADRAGVVLPTRRVDDPSIEQRQHRYDALSAATSFFQRALRTTEGKPALDYLLSRGVNSDSLDRFQLGWAPDGWDHLTRHLTDQGVDAKILVDTGLVGERDGGGHYDRFRARVIFPIKDERGNVTGFGARTLGNDQPKYLNSPQTSLFDKGASLFAVDQARAAIRSMNRATIVEGYLDAIIAHQHGFKDVVASLGTALTERQLAILKRLTRSVVLAMDSDAAGDEAVLRGLDVTRQVFADATVPVVSPRGLVHLESRLGAEILIATLPRGRDPDDIIRDRPDEWREIVGRARSIVDFYFDVVLSRADMTSARGASDAVHQLLPIIGEVGDTIQQAHYLQKLSDRVHIAEQLLASEMRRLRLTTKSVKAAPPVDVARPRQRSSLDERLIALMLSHPQTCRDAIDGLDDDCWELVESREVVTAMRGALDEGRPIDLKSVSALVPEPVADWLAAVIGEQSGEPEIGATQAQNEVVNLQRDIRRRHRQRQADRLRSYIEDLQANGEQEALRDVYRQLDRELTELWIDEQNSSNARVWRKNPSSFG